MKLPKSVRTLGWRSADSKTPITPQGDRNLEHRGNQKNYRSYDKLGPNGVRDRGR